MTNDKMPVVGRRYKGPSGEIETVVKIIGYKDNYSVVTDTQSSYIDKHFWIIFEELPESPKVNANLQESAQSEISEVDKALEELKLLLLNSSFFAGVLSKHAINKGDLVRKAAERLVNAIETKRENYSEFKFKSLATPSEIEIYQKFYEKYPEAAAAGEKELARQLATNLFEDKEIPTDFEDVLGGKKQVEEEKKSDLEDALIYEQAFSRVFMDQEGNFRKEGIPFKEIYKEPEPRYPFKNISELPQFNSMVIFRTKNNFTEIGNGYDNFLLDYCKKEVDLKTVKNFCLLTDLINAFEQLQRDVEELKNKVR
jgi:hypothetical protein